MTVKSGSRVSLSVLAGALVLAVVATVGLLQSGPNGGPRPVPVFSPFQSEPDQKPSGEWLQLRVNWYDDQIPEPGDALDIVVTYRGEHKIKPPRVTFAFPVGLRRDRVQRTWMVLVVPYDGSPVKLEARSPRNPNADLTCHVLSGGVPIHPQNLPKMEEALGIATCYLNWR